MDILDQLRNEMARDIQLAPKNTIDAVFETIMKTAKHDLGSRIIMFLFGKERVISFMIKYCTLENKKAIILASIKNKKSSPYSLAAVMSDHGWTPSDALTERMEKEASM